jgi:hypothetical protein
MKPSAIVLNSGEGPLIARESVEPRINTKSKSNPVLFAMKRLSAMRISTSAAKKMTIARKLICSSVMSLGSTPMPSAECIQSCIPRSKT